jgi:hypothetical protein
MRNVKDAADANFEFERRSIEARWYLYCAATCRREHIGATIASPETLGRVYTPRSERGLKAGPAMVRYVSWRDDDCNLEAGVTIPERAEPEGTALIQRLEACEVAAVKFLGPYSQLGEPHEACIR